MPFGHVNTRLVLNKPNIIHCGSDSEVSGQIFVDFTTRQVNMTELFGPMEIFIVLTGRAKSKITESSSTTASASASVSNTSTTVYRGRAPLVWTKYFVQQGPIRIQQGVPQVFNFAIHFPDRVQPLDVDHFDLDPRFNISSEGPLPPSMSCRFHESECFVEYRLSTEVHMPSIDVRIHNFLEEDGGLLINYEQPHVPAALAQAARIHGVRETLRVSNEFLLPESERPVGFRAKTKAFFKSDAYPTYVCSVWIDGSAYLQLGQPITLELRVPPHLHETTASELPEVKIAYITITIRATTEIRTARHISRSVERHHTEKVLLLAGTMHDSRPFSKANDWTKQVTTLPITGLPSTFSTFNIARTYTMDFEVLFDIATKKKKVKFAHIPVRILPPALDAAPTAALPFPMSSSESSVTTTSGGPFVNQEMPPGERDPPRYNEKNNGHVVSLAGKG